jgi:hypothetical protein
LTLFGEQEKSVRIIDPKNKTLSMVAFKFWAKVKRGWGRVPPAFQCLP